MNMLELLILSKTQYKYIIPLFLSGLICSLKPAVILMKRTKVPEGENLLNRLFLREF